jgi:hypothetical protein
MTLLSGLQIGKAKAIDCISALLEKRNGALKMQADELPVNILNEEGNDEHEALKMRVSETLGSLRRDQRLSPIRLLTFGAPVDLRIGLKAFHPG